MRISMPKVVTTAAVIAVVTLVSAQAAVADSPSPIPVSPVTSFPASPSPSSSFNWKQRAIDYDSFVYDWGQPGGCSTIQTDTAHYNMSTETFKMPTYYCDTSQLGSTNGQQEAWNQVASVVGASLVGIDKSDQSGRDYVDMNQTFFNPTLGVALDKPNVPASNVFASSYAYMGLTNALYYMMGALYPNATNMPTILRSIADKYYDEIAVLGGANVNFSGGGFNFSTMQPINNGGSDLEGGDGAVGAATIMLWAYSKFGDPKYLNGAKWAMDYVEKSSQSLFYEVMPLFAPYIAARLNATEGTNYSVGKAFANVLGGSAVRGGWGTINSQWGGYDAYGLVGSQTDGGGYAFAMNSFATSMFSATAKYDTRYADTVGRWLLNVNNAARFFYADQMPTANQYYGSTYTADPAHVIPYEGLRASQNGQSPSAAGDPTFFGSSWGLSPTATNLSLYSGSWVGFLGGIIAPTNVPDVNQIDLNKLDFYSAPSYPEHLYYNPSSSDANVQINVGASAREVYDAVSDSVLLTGASGTQTIVIPAGSSRVIVLAPSNGTPTIVNGNTVINGVTVRYSTESPDLAHDAPVIVSSTANGNVAANLTDGSASTRWESQASDPQAFYVDLGSSKTISRVDLDWETASAKSFEVDTSTDATNWTQVYSTSAGPGGDQKVSFSPTKARYVRVSMTQRNTQWAYSLWDFHVYDDDLAMSAPATSSSTANGNLASNLTDGNSSTRWESQASDPQAFFVDLGSAQTIDTVDLDWETASAKSFEIDISTDASTWTSVYSTTSGPGGDQIVSFSPVTARYVRVDLTQRNTQWAYSLWDFGVYDDDIGVSAAVVASSTVNGNVPGNLTDGLRTTRWESQTSDPQAFYIDLGSSRTVGSVVLDWQRASAKSFRIDTSTDEANWSTVYSTTTGPGGLQNISFPATPARYVRVFMTQRNTQWAYSLWEFGVHSK